MNIENMSAGVADLLNELPGQFDVTLANYFAGAGLSAEQKAVLTQFGRMTVNEFLFQRVTKPRKEAEDIMAATTVLTDKGTLEGAKLGVLLSAYYVVWGTPEKGIL